MTALVWYRADLRVHDHEPLTLAAASGPVVGVYCVDGRLLAPGLGGVSRLGPHRARFLLEALADLRAAWRARGGTLLLRVGTPAAVIPAVARAVGATTVWAHAEACPDERDDERAVRQALSAQGATLRLCWGHTLLHRDDLPMAVAALPATFTQFRTAVEGARVPPRAVLPAPARLAGPAVAAADEGALPTLASLGVAEPAPDPRARMAMPGGEAAAHARMRAWIWEGDHLRRYKETRNGMLEPDDQSRLSPWLAHGCLSPRQVAAEVARYEAERVRNASTYWLVFELLWRDYFRLAALVEGASLFARGGPRGREVTWRDDAAAFARWAGGRTGVALCDASQRELVATGWTSNRARQNVASYLAKTLRLDWRLGAAWYEHWLVDYDAPSNWGNWAYAAGVGRDPREDRVFNLEKQARDYDPQGRYRAHWG